MSVEYERQKFIEIKESNDLVNWAKGYNGFKIVPQARDHGQSDTCQFYGVVAGGDMGYNKSMADHKKSSDIHFEEEDLIAEAKSVHKIEGKITADNAPYSHDLLAIFEDNGVMATSSEWDGMEKRNIAGFSSGLPKRSQIMDLIKQAVPLLGHFDCCKYFGTLKPNQVYVPPKMLRGKRKLADLDKVTGLNPHLVLICGFGVFQRLLYLIFLNSWSERFCQDGYGRIPFNSITLFHTLEIL